MKISIFGAGYVGLVTAACLAEVGHHVICVDVDAAKIDKLNIGIIPFWEPGLDALVRHNANGGRLQFTTDVPSAVAFGKVQVIAVGTPSEEDGSADLQYVLAVAQEIACHMVDYKVIINKSTVPVGTADDVQLLVKTVLGDRGEVLDFDVVSNPEFLREGVAVNDFLKPDRIVVGSESERAKAIMRELYEPFNRNHERTIFMGIRSAELTKYAANAMLATKISFMNEMANIAERLGVDIEQVRKGIGSDHRIGHHFINPGCGYGGSCFPKDVKALAHVAQRVGYEAKLLHAVESINQYQKGTLFQKLAACIGGAELFDDKIIAVWGLSFKPNTDDMREAPSRTLIESLRQHGALIQAYDPIAREEAKRIYGERANLVLCDDKYGALQDADALVICTEWQQFRSPDFAEMELRMRGKVIIDGRNLYQPYKLQQAGWKYISVGRGVVDN